MSRKELKDLRELLARARTCESCSPLHGNDGKPIHESVDIINAIYTIEAALERPIYINTYIVTRHYGGPEEGGWWYNQGHLIETLETSEDKADEERSKMEEKHKDKNEGDINSVLGGTLLEVVIEETPGEDYPATKPQYS